MIDEKKDIELGAPVPREEYEFFKESFPQYGSVKWFISTVLKEFNEQVRNNPTVKEHINEAIRLMVEENRLATRSEIDTVITS